ncbi:MAG: phosphopentomutase [Firmicutes bacterium]|nr:phosphopentomutase [Bacillota bacterium]
MIKLIPVPEPGQNSRRAIIVLLDGAGVGALPDAAAYGDAGANTLLHVLTGEGPLALPRLKQLGLEEILQLASGSTAVLPAPPAGAGYYGRASSRAAGKDSTSGHWELAGVIMAQPFPVYPRGFPPEIISAFEEVIGRPCLGNCRASGTEIIEVLGEHHLQSGFPIVYTSADSVFQVAAHERITPPEQLYRWCTAARAILQGEHAVGRVIARPFEGNPGTFKRTSRRKDFSLPPPGRTLLDQAAAAGYPVAVIGKVADIFDHRGVTVHRPASGNEATAAALLALLAEIPRGIIWATFGDFDTLYGHRNDCRGFAAALESFDRFLGRLLGLLRPGDLLFITADHGCDPTWPGTDHTREHVPLIAWGPAVKRRCPLGTRPTFADLGASAAAWLRLSPLENGESFLDCR